MRTEDDDGEVEIALSAAALRQAAVAVRRAVALHLRERGNERVIRDAAVRRGELIDTIVEREDGDTWLLRASDQWAVLPPEEQMEGEKLTRQQHLKVVVIDARHRGKEAVIVVSRSHPQLVRALLEQEVPEVASGDVIIKGIAREAGRRCKVAVWAADPALDPQGACIGPRGVRHRAMAAQLADEQLQIVRWDEDSAVYIANALAPATVNSVVLELETKTAAVRVPADRLSLAIGRGGENARLVARLTGWRIDISAEATPEPGRGPV